MIPANRFFAVDKVFLVDGTELQNVQVNFPNEHFCIVSTSNKDNQIFTWYNVNQIMKFEGVSYEQKKSMKITSTDGKW